jgi:hypothetical protein
MVLKTFSPKNIAKKMASLTHNAAAFCKSWIITLVFFKEKRQFFRQKWATIAENFDHNIDRRCFYFGIFLWTTLLDVCTQVRT